MKIIHSADWHIGKKLQKYDLSEDFSLFKKWLIDYIKEHQVDILLVSGDIFDTSNPSVESRKLYYDALLEIYKTGCKAVITAGNHDSALILNAPKHLVEILNIYVVGSFPKDPKDCLFRLKSKDEREEIIIAGVPFLTNAELLKLSSGIFSDEKQKAIIEGIKNTFEEILNYCKAHHPKQNVIAMGHFFAAGNIERSESEREVQIGNSALFDMDLIPKGFSYFALGHIHKPQRVSSSTPTFYSGSPYCLSFSEKNDRKRILLIDTEEGFEPKSIEIPLFRKLKTIKGNFSSVKEALNALKEEENAQPLENLLEVIVEETTYNPEIEANFLTLLQEFNLEGYKIIKPNIVFKDRVESVNEIFSSKEKIEDLTPYEIFDRLLTTQDITEEDKDELKRIFSDILEELL